jgi:transcriptional regulator with PAS, ATPase and Fis domain
MLVGDSAVMVQLRRDLGRIARTDFTVLIDGESGAGKELAARCIHAESRRARGPFVAVNCAAIVETLVEPELFGIEERTATGVRGRPGKFELAQAGTLFLDEVGDLSAGAQAKLLRVLQDLVVERVGGAKSQRVDVRIVAATNRPLTAMVADGRFRADLYYRLSGVEIRVPPLRERRDDLPLLAAYLLQRHANPVPWRVTSSAMEAMKLYDWPGNVRQLGRVMERAVALAQTTEITVRDLAPEVRGPFEEVTSAMTPASDCSLDAWARRYARLVLERCDGNKRQACHTLEISYNTLRAYLRERPPRSRA